MNSYLSCIGMAKIIDFAGQRGSGRSRMAGRESCFAEVEEMGGDYLHGRVA